MDLALSLVEEDHGAGPARDTARELVVFMARPGGQSQFSARLRPREAEHPAVRAAMDAVSADPAGPHSPAALAGLGKVSARHLARLFRSETGLSPAQYIASVRLEAAQDLLASGTDPSRRWPRGRASDRPRRCAGRSSRRWASPPPTTGPVPDDGRGGRGGTGGQLSPAPNGRRAGPLAQWAPKPVVGPASRRG
ncbi:hypothetical protein SBADM41S_10840 [Streptomyces badius]